MYHNNLKRLRNEQELTQKEVAKTLNCNRNTYNNWEQGVVMIPLDIADILSCYYKVSLSCIYGIENDFSTKENIKSINYKTLLDNLMKLKKQNKHTYKIIAKALNCTESTAQRYFTGVIVPPSDRLVLLTKLYNVDLDSLCGVEF